MPSFDYKRLLPHLYAVLGFILVACIYASPALQGKRLAQHDAVQAEAAAHEVKEYHQQTGEWSAWTNSMFGGMPAYLIATDYPQSFTTRLGRILGGFLPEPIGHLFTMMLGMYVLLLALWARGWLAVLGSVAFAFASYHLMYIQAGHMSKIIALAWMPGILAGVLWAWRGRPLLGGAVLALFLGLNLYGNHVQITYYAFIAIAVLGVIEGVAAVREGRLKSFALGSVALAGGAALAVGTHATRLWTTQQYSGYSMRGKSELTTKTTGTNPSQSAANGLDKEYAFNWSYGKAESFTLLIPGFYGGKSSGGLDTKSETYKAMTAKGVDAAAARQFVEQGAPMYFGSQPGTSGSAYAGAIVMFLFVLAMFIVKDRLKWWLLGMAGLFLMLSWGKNFGLLNDPFFDYFPAYNKFRAVTMLLSVIQVFLAAGAVLALKTIFDEKPPFESIKRPFLISLGLTAGLSGLLALLPGLFMDFRGENDAAILAQVFGSPEAGNEFSRTLIADRQSLFRADALRSALFILVAAGLLWAFLTNKLKAAVVLPVLTVLMVLDLFPVGKRYFNNGDFVSKAAQQQTFTPSPADEQILRDKSLSYRVFDGTTDAFSDARASYYHKSVGGYHGAKMKRFQEVIEYQLRKEPLNVAVLNMLNTKYFILPDRQTGQPAAQQNPDALGNAWFVPDYKIVVNADEEMAGLTNLNPRQTALVDKRFESLLNGLKIQPDSAANRIELTAYKPNALTYRSTTTSPQLAVFSEIFYRGNDDWKAYVDGKETPHFRANYLLRAMVVPAGQHTIEFKFEPPAVSTGHTIDLISSLLLVVFLVVAVGVEVRKKPKP